jgi:DNA-binding CsgD family transcriptional regulator/tetratricopeptide (TPR) repeat protein
MAGGAGLTLRFHNRLPCARSSEALGVQINVYDENMSTHVRGDTSSTTTLPGRRSPFSGRQGEIETILLLASAANEGATATLLVTGEPGVGKTRLTAEGCDQIAAQLGAQTFRGVALDLAEGLPPLHPLEGALRPLIADRSAALPKPVRAVLAAAGLAPSGGVNLVERVDQPAERLRIAEALADVMTTVTSQQLALLTLDDMQWASPALWNVLTHLMRLLDGHRLLLVLSARDEVVTNNVNATRALSGWARQRALTHLHLDMMQRGELQALSETILGGDVAEELIDDLIKRTGGNPFFLEETLAHLLGNARLELRDGRWTLGGSRDVGHSTTLRMVISDRVHSLATPVQRALESAAVLGSAFSVRVLAQMIGASDETTLASLQQAAEAALVEPDADDRWRFRHDTVREAVYESTTDGHASLHQAAAEALTAGGGIVPSLETLGTVAQHWKLAGNQQRAGRSAAAAALAAADLRRTEETLRWARAARSAIDIVGSRSEIAESRALHGEAALTAGEDDQAGEAFRAALDVAVASLERARLWTKLGTIARRQERPDEAAGCFATARSELDGDTETHSLVAAEIFIAECELDSLTRARYDNARESGERGLSLARRHGDTQVTARAALALANTVSRAGYLLRSRPLLHEALAAALAARDSGRAVEVCASLANSHYWSGELGESHRFAVRRLSIAEESGDLFSLRHAHSWLALLAFSRGDWADARARIAQAEPALRRLASPEPLAFLRVIQALVEWRTGPIADARAYLDEAIALLSNADDSTIVWYGGLLAVLALEEGDRAAAETHIRAQERRLETIPDDALPARSARVVLGLAYARVGDVTSAAVCEAALRRFASDFHWWPARQTLAELALLRGDQRQAKADLALAIADCRREQLLPDLALNLQRAATFEAPGEERTHQMGEARRLFARLGMNSTGTGKRRSLATPATADPLTRRESEVLDLLALGKSNREIAFKLFITEHTVVNHLSNIFAKLGVRNRSAAVAYALTRQDSR